MDGFEQKQREFTFIDLFAGAGGLSEGFTACGFRPIAHVEMNPHACDTLRTRACYWWLRENNKLFIYKDYLNKKLTRDEMYSAVPQQVLDSVICEEMSDSTMGGILKQIDALIESSRSGKPDLIIGGPPCQAYSIVGRGRKDMSDDPRNYLYRQYLKVLDRYKPKMFVFENVPGLKTAGGGKYLKSIQTSFKERGYNLDCQIQDAADYGVLQTRKRIILVGWREDTGFQYPALDEEKEETTDVVWDILKDLPALQPGEQSGKYSETPMSDYLRRTGIRRDGDILTWHVARPHIERDRKIYRCAINAWFDEGRHLRYSELPDELKTHQNTTAFTDRFKVVEGNQHTCHTMVAHISKDGHYYIHPDIKQSRSITVREAARVQSFPDDFFFEGPRTAAFIQIGNAVPPLLAKAIAKAVIKEFYRGEFNDGHDD